MRCDWRDRRTRHALDLGDVYSLIADRVDDWARRGVQHGATSRVDELSTPAVVLRIELGKACGVLTVSDSGDGDLASLHADGGDVSHKAYRALIAATVHLALEDVEGMIPVRAQNTSGWRARTHRTEWLVALATRAPATYCSRRIDVGRRRITRTDSGESAMWQRVRSRFWVEIALCVLSGVAIVLTALWPEWIESVFHVEPDGGSGSAEWLIVGVAIALFIGSSTIAAAEVRRARRLVATPLRRLSSNPA